MTDEPTMKLTDFDYLVGDHHLQMVKAALPYVNVAEQRLLSLFVKLRELQRTVSLFQEEQVAAMGICSVDEKQKGSPLEMMKAIRPYGNTQEQDFIDIVCNFLQGPRPGGQYPDIVSAQSASDHIPEDLPPSHIVPDSRGFAGSPARAGLHPDVPVPEACSPSPLCPPVQAVHSARSPLEQLKGFLPPDQQARLEQATFLIQALQQLT